MRGAGEPRRADAAPAPARARERPPRHRGAASRRSRAPSAVAVAPQPPGVRGALDQGDAVSPASAVLDYEMSNLRSATKALELPGRRRARGPRARRRGGRGRRGAARASGNFGEAMRRIRAQRPRRGRPRRRRRAACRCWASAWACSCCSRRARRAPASAGLGLLPGPVRRLRTDLKLPHIGWSRVALGPGRAAGPGAGATAATPPTTSSTPTAASPRTRALVLGRADHGVAFCAAAGRPGVLGVQFHPEKSSAAGLGPARPLARRRCAPARPATRDHALPGDRPAGRPGRAPAPGRLRPVDRLQRRPGGPGAGASPSRAPSRSTWSTSTAPGRASPCTPRWWRASPPPSPGRSTSAAGCARGAAIETALATGVDRRGGGHGGARGRASCWAGPSTASGDGLVVALDARQGKVATHGWTQVSDRDAVRGGDEPGVAWACGGWPTRTSAATARSAGPTSTRDAAAGRGGAAAAADRLRRDLVARRPARACATWTLANLDGVIVGRALYEGRFTVTEALERARGAEPLVIRVIPCLDVNAGRVVKGVNFVGLRDAGDPVELAARYDREGADELVFLDITASHEERDTIVELARRTAEEVFIPFTIGGGLRSEEDIRAVLAAGADKVVAELGRRPRPRAHRARVRAVRRPVHRGRDRRQAARGRLGLGGLPQRRAPADRPRGRRLGRRGRRAGGGGAAGDEHGPRRHQGRLRRRAAGGGGRRGAGAGDRLGRRRAASSTSPTRSSRGRADAVLAASVFHDGVYSIAEVKAAMARRGRPGAPVGCARVRTHPHRGRARARRRRPLQPGRRGRDGEGEMVWVSGQLGIDPASGALVDGDVARADRPGAAPRRRDPGRGRRRPGDVVKTTVYLTDLAGDFPAMNEVYGHAFAGARARPGDGRGARRCRWAPGSRSRPWPSSAAAVRARAGCRGGLLRPGAALEQAVEGDAVQVVGRLADRASLVGRIAHPGLEALVGRVERLLELGERQAPRSARTPRPAPGRPARRRELAGDRVVGHAEDPSAPRARDAVLPRIPLVRRMPPALQRRGQRRGRRGARRAARAAARATSSTWWWRATPSRGRAAGPGAGRPRRSHPRFGTAASRRPHGGRVRPR